MIKILPPVRKESRNLEVVDVYRRKGEIVVRSLWIKASPRHPLLKLAIMPPLIGIMALVILLMLVIALTFLSVALLLTILKSQQKKEE